MFAIASSSSSASAPSIARRRESPFQGVSSNIFRLMQETDVRCCECFRTFAFQEDVRVHRATLRPSQAFLYDTGQSVAEEARYAVESSIMHMHPRHRICLIEAKTKAENTRALSRHVRNCGQCVAALLPPLPPPPQPQNGPFEIPMDNPPPQALPVDPANLPPSFEDRVHSFILGVNVDSICALVHLIALQLFAAGGASLGLPIFLLFGLEVVVLLVSGVFQAVFSIALLAKVHEKMGIAVPYYPSAHLGNILAAKAGIFWSLGAGAVVNPLKALRIALISLIALNALMAAFRH